MNVDLAKYLEGDLGPARRHLWRIEQGELPPTPAVLREIARSIERCVERLHRATEKGDADAIHPD